MAVAAWNRRSVVTLCGNCGVSYNSNTPDEGSHGIGKCGVRTTPRSCNKHSDCDAADERNKAIGQQSVHCHDDDCEECFGC